MTVPPINVIIVDDHPVVLQGFAYMLQDVPGIHLREKFSNASAAMEFLKCQTADVVLLDINLPDMNGIDACRMLHKLYPTLRIVAISNINEHSIIHRMLDNGANGYLLKNSSSTEVVDSIRRVMTGETVFNDSIRATINSYEAGNLPVITRREKEILALLARGLSSIEIGEQIFISPLTVESHRRNLLHKFKVTNVAALIHKATEMKYC